MPYTVSTTLRYAVELASHSPLLRTASTTTQPPWRAFESIYATYSLLPLALFYLCCADLCSVQMELDTVLLFHDRSELPVIRITMRVLAHPELHYIIRFSSFSLLLDLDLSDLISPFPPFP